MKKISAFATFALCLMLAACNVQTTTDVILDFDRYLFFGEDPYFETQPGTFVFAEGTAEEETIQASLGDHGAVYSASFSEAIFTVYDDGSLLAVFPDDWTAACDAGTGGLTCTYTDFDPIRQEEVESLDAFASVEVMPASYYPLADYPDEPRLMPWEAIIVISLGLVLLLLTVGILSGSRTIDKLLLVGKPRAINGGNINVNLAMNGNRASPTNLGNMFLAKDATDDAYARVDEHPDEPKPEADDLRARIRAGWKFWVAAALVFGLVLAAMLIW